MDQRLITFQWRLLDRNPPEEGKRQLKCSHHRSGKYSCKASWSMITTGYVEIRFFLFSYVDFQRSVNYFSLFLLFTF